MANDAMWVIYDALDQEQGARPGTVGTVLQGGAGGMGSGLVCRGQGVRAVVTIITTSKWFSEMLFELFAGNDFYFRK